MGYFNTRILNPDDAVKAFIAEWENGNDYVTAHTSGSTGVPKDIRLKKADMWRSAQATNKFFNICGGDVLRCPLSCNYIAGKMMAVRALAADATVDFARDISTTGMSDIKLMSVVPAQIDHLLEDYGNVNRIENLLIGGSPLSGRMERRLIESGVNAYISFGMTETCSHIAIRKCGDDHYTTLPGIEVSNDERGCLVVNAPEFTFNGIVTNDVIELVSGRKFRWLGRYDNAIISGGVKVFAETIESKLRGIIPAGVNYYITWEPHERWGQSVVLVVDSPIEIDRSALQCLSPAERPKKVITANITFTDSGKVRRLKP